MGMLHDLGFHARPPAGWNGWWVLMWAITTPTLMVLAFVFPVTWGFWWLWVVAALILFGIPEWIGVRRTEDNLPPSLTQSDTSCRTGSPFPIIYGFLGAIGARWLAFGYPRFWGWVACSACSARSRITSRLRTPGLIHTRIASALEKRSP